MILADSDKILAKKAIQGLIAYAGVLAGQSDGLYSPKIEQARRIVDEIGAYWDVDEKKDWASEFDKTVQRVQNGNNPPNLSHPEKIAAVNGLFRYAQEMLSAQGTDALERIQETVSVIQSMGETFKMSDDWIKEVTGTIEMKAEQLAGQTNQEPPSFGMTMQ